MSDKHFILVVPEILGKEIIYNCHNQLGFHFSKRQMLSLLRHLIYHPRLKIMIDTIVNQCLLCTLNAPKRIKKLIGSRRTNYFVLSQCLILYSCYLPKSQSGYSKALICVDACTGYVIVYPSTNLQADTVHKHTLTYLSSHLLPSEIKADFGSECKKQFDRFIANYGISLSSCKPLSKGSIRDRSYSELVIFQSFQLPKQHQVQ